MTDVVWARGGKKAVLDTYLKLHEGKFGAHWLWSAIQRIAGGEGEVEVLDDFGYALKSEAAEFAKREVHPLLMTTGEFGRCDHGSAVFSPSGEWIGCGECRDAFLTDQPLRQLLELADDALTPLANAHFPMERECLTDDDSRNAQRAGRRIREFLAAMAAAQSPRQVAHSSQAHSASGSPARQGAQPDGQDGISAVKDLSASASPATKEQQ